MRIELRGSVAKAMLVLAVFSIAVVVLPLIVLFPLAIEPGSILRYPPNGFSLRWFIAFLSSHDWLHATALSFTVALITSLFATILGTSAALGLARAPWVIRKLIYVLLLSPIFLPAIVVAVSLYGLYVTLGLIGTVFGLVLAHTLITLPFVIVTVAALIHKDAQELEEAALGLGAHPVSVFFQVTLPLLFRGIMAGGLLAFLISFDEVVIAMFVTGTDLITLPTRVLDSVFHDTTPMLAAVSTLIVGGNLIILAIILILLRPKFTSTSS
jgi:putative spermidine/putrescine transport system permease protein